MCNATPLWSIEEIRSIRPCKSGWKQLVAVANKEGTGRDVQLTFPKLVQYVGFLQAAWCFRRESGMSQFRAYLQAVQWLCAYLMYAEAPQIIKEQAHFVMRVFKENGGTVTSASLRMTSDDLDAILMFFGFLLKVAQAHHTIKNCGPDRTYALVSVASRANTSNEAALGSFLSGVLTMVLNPERVCSDYGTNETANLYSGPSLEGLCRDMGWTTSKE